MKCKRLCAWLLSLVMMFSLLPVSAAAKWYGEHNVTVKKDNVITIDQYYSNGSIIPQRSGKNFKVNGPEIVENNKLEKGAIIDNHELTAATEKYRFLTVGDTTYDFSYARQIPYPGESSDIKLAKVWYERDTGKWYYSHFDNTKVLLVNKSGVNFCYNKEHTENSKHHDFEVVRTVLPTCTKGGYTVYKCAYCDYTEQRETAALGHAWSAWTHDDATSGADSMHTHTCMRKGCNETERSQCNFTISGTDHLQRLQVYLRRLYPDL